MHVDLLVAFRDHIITEVSQWTLANCRVVPEVQFYEGQPNPCLQIADGGAAHMDTGGGAEVQQPRITLAFFRRKNTERFGRDAQVGVRSAAVLSNDVADVVEAIRGLRLGQCYTDFHLITENAPLRNRHVKDVLSKVLVYTTMVLNDYREPS